MRSLIPSGRSLFTLGLLGVASVAWAATGWYQFDTAFKPLPCQDGWMACMQGDDYVTPGMTLDKNGRPHPSHMRFGFFEFEPMPSLSPVAGLSDYSNSEDAFADADDGEEVEDRPTRKAAAPTPAERPERAEREEREERDPVPVPVPAPDVDNEPEERNEPPPPLPPEEPPPEEPPPEEPPPPPPEEPEKKEPPPEEPPAQKEAPEPPAVAEKAPPPPTPPPEPPPEPQGCDDLIALEAPAMMGELGAGRRQCLERRLASSRSQTDKRKISLVLLADAEARQNQGDWSRLMKRHLEHIDRSDPNMCFKYAAYLSRRGAGSAYGVIRWSDYALENKSKWSGNTYKKYVYGLYRLRAQAANKLWQHNAEKYAADSKNEKAKSDAELYRGKAKDFSREWLDYARASGQSTKNPMALCVSAAGNKSFCGG